MEAILLENGKYKCNFCNEEKSKYGIKNHIAISHLGDIKRVQGKKGKFGIKPWNKNLNKTDKRIEKSVQTFSNNYKSGKNKIWCQGKTKETDTRVLKNSFSISKTITKKIKNGTWHNSFSKSRTHEYNNQKFYGTWELNYAKWLDENKIKWRKVTETFQYEFEGKKRRYTPDFYLIDEQCYIEIKGYETDKDRAKWKQFPFKLKILKGKELKDLGIIKNFKDLKLKKLHKNSE